MEGKVWSVQRTEKAEQLEWNEQGEAKDEMVLRTDHSGLWQPKQEMKFCSKCKSSGAASRF